MMRTKLTLAAILVCLSQAAQAADSGIYLGAGFASGRLSGCANVTSTCNNFAANSQDSGHLRLIGGYDFNKYIGIEAGLSQLGTYKVKNTALATVGTAKVSSFSLAAKGGYTFPHGFSIFGKLGVGSVTSKYTADAGMTIPGGSEQTSTGLLFGMGGQYNFTEMVGIRLLTEVIGYKDGAYTAAAGGTNLLLVVKF